ncbi:MAG TPA: (2Fe-2S) ferredoxin domain-containing protein [Alphaproteobacteria bacterium]|jgi:(2Fe-2S) ferredoxin
MSDANGGRKLLYDPHIFICTEEKSCRAGASCCGQQGTAELLGYMKATAKARGIDNIRVNRSTCLERCEQGPVMVLYPEGIWYSFRSQRDIDEIIDKHLVRGGRAERLMVDPSGKAAGKATV